MTITVQSAGGAGAHSGATSMQITPGVQCYQGDTLVIMLGCDNSGTSGTNPISGSGSCTDSRGLSWNLRQAVSRTGGTVDDGACCAIWEAEVGPAGFSASDTVTVSFTATVTARVLTGYRIVADTNKYYVCPPLGNYNTMNNAGFTSAAQWQIGAVSAGNVYIFALASEGNAVPTSYKNSGDDENDDNPGSNCHGLWTGPVQTRCDTTTGTTHMSLCRQAIPVTSAGNCGWTMGFAASNDRAACWIGLVETAATVTNPPGTPSVSVNGVGSYQVTFTAPGYDGHRAPNQYDVYYDAGGGWAFHSSHASAGAKTCGGFGPGANVRFKVYAGNSVGWSGESGYSGYVSMWNYPGAPTSLSVTPQGGGSYNLSWSAPGSNGGTAITDYRVEYRQNGGSWTLFNDGVSTSTSASVTGLNQTDDWDFRAAAINAVGYTNWSNTASSVNEQVSASTVAKTGTTQTATATSSATFTAATVAKIGTTQAATETGSSTASASAVAKTAVVQNPTRTAITLVSASVVAKTAAVQTPTRTTTTLATASVVAKTGVVQVPAPRTDATIPASTVAKIGATNSVASITTAAMAQASAVARTATTQTVTPTGDSIVEVVAVSKTGAVLASTVTGSSLPSPSLVTGTGTTQSTTQTGSGVASPSAVAGTATIWGPNFSVSVSFTTVTGIGVTQSAGISFAVIPNLVGSLSAFPTPTGIEDNGIIAPASVVAKVGAVSAPTTTGSSHVDALLIVGTGSTKVAAVDFGSTAPASPVVKTGVVQTATETGSSIAAAAAIARTGTVSGPLSTGSSIVSSPPRVSGVAQVRTPSASSDDVVFVQADVADGAAVVYSTTFTASGVASPSAVAKTGAAQSPTPGTTDVLLASTVTRSATTQAPTLKIAVVAAPIAVAGVGTAKAISLSAVALAVTVARSATIYSLSNLTAGTVASPSTAIGSRIVAIPTIFGVILATPNTVTGSATTYAGDARGNLTFAATAVARTATVFNATLDFTMTVAISTSVKGAGGHVYSPFPQVGAFSLVQPLEAIAGIGVVFISAHSASEVVITTPVLGVGAAHWDAYSFTFAQV